MTYAMHFGVTASGHIRGTRDAREAQRARYLVALVRDRASSIGLSSATKRRNVCPLYFEEADKRLTAVILRSRTFRSSTLRRPARWWTGDPEPPRPHGKYHPRSRDAAWRGRELNDIYGRLINWFSVEAATCALLISLGRDGGGRNTHGRAMTLSDQPDRLFCPRDRITVTQSAQ